MPKSRLLFFKQELFNMCNISTISDPTSKSETMNFKTHNKQAKSKKFLLEVSILTRKMHQNSSLKTTIPERQVKCTLYKQASGFPAVF